MHDSGRARSGNALLGIALVSLAPFQEQWWEALPRPEWDALTRVPIEQSIDWFEVYEAAPGVLALYEPGHWEEALAYLILGTDRALLFDTLMGIGDLRPVVEQLTDLPIVVMNSHSHYDHVGSNSRFETVLATDLDYTRANARGLDNAAARGFVPEGSIWKPTPAGFDRDTWTIPAWTVGRFVADGDTVDLGGRVLEVLLTPGHAPDALCLLDRANGILFTGDTYYRGPLFAHLPGSDFEQYAATAARLAALRDEISLLMPGHNTAAVSAGDLVELDAAFRAVQAGTVDYAEVDGVREYSFTNFRLMTPH
jgi:glyoxylase-like metal-dependent hydrolase (beta-lactamase superfamily II)